MKTLASFTAGILIALAAVWTFESTRMQPDLFTCIDSDRGEVLIVVDGHSAFGAMEVALSPVDTLRLMEDLAQELERLK